MSDGTAPGPARGPARPSFLRTWLLAIRPATLPAAASGVIVGLGAALAVGTPFRLDTALGCLVVALLLQVLANLANDLSDHRRGADTPDRAGPTRVAATGLVSERQLEVAIAVVIVLAGLVGLWLVAVGGWVLLALGALAIVAALAYTGGPFPYGYRALGEVFVFLFFGLVAVVGTAYLQALVLYQLFVVAAIPVGALTTAILVVNNLRDIPTDAAAGKRTLAVILGRRWTAVEYALLLGAAFAVPLALAVRGGGLLPPIAAALPLLALPLAVPLLRTVRDFTDPRELNPVLKGTARLSFAFAVLFALSLRLAAVGT
jgi:1,4-dihydroxy-2-naphthoate octaprenyltransferase